MTDTEYSDIFEEIRDTVSLSDEMESHGIRLTPSGRSRLKCCCPFQDHSDATPSCAVYVNESPEHFYCFGCKKHGTIIDFCMHYGKDGQSEMTLRQAIEYLVKKYNLSADMSDISRIKNIPNKYKRNELPIFSKSLILAEEIRDFMKGSLDPDRDFSEVKDYMKNIDEAIYDKDLATIEVFDESIGKALKGVRKGDRLYQVFTKCKNCNECDLRAYCQNPTFGTGGYGSKTMIIGERPTIPESKEDKIFSDEIGKIVRKALQDHNIDVSKVWLTNVICCSSGKPPEEEQLKFCSDIYLSEQIKEIKPSTIILLGEKVKNSLLPRYKEKSILQLWGRYADEEIYGHDARVVFSIDPRYVFHSRSTSSETYKRFARIIAKATTV